MIFVTGPLYSGKRTYLADRFGWDEQAMAENVAAEVQEQAAGLTPAQLEQLADRLAQKPAVTASELGGGVVPLDPGQRAARENAGRLAILLARRAGEVVRVFCGLPTVIKKTQDDE